MDILNKFLNLIFPQRCAFCGKIITSDIDICPECIDNAYIIGNDICSICGRDINGCDCGNKKMEFNSCIAPFYFTDNIKDAIYKLKFSKSPYNAKVLSDLMTDRVRELYSSIEFDLIIFVPMHPKKILIRGYNQVEYLAKYISKNLDIPLYSNILYKSSLHESQHKTKGSERFENIKDTFTTKNNYIIKDKTILVVDDIFTTGSTLNEVAKTLKTAGAKNIYGIVFAATQYLK